MTTSPHPRPLRRTTLPAALTALLAALVLLSGCTGSPRSDAATNPSPDRSSRSGGTAEQQGYVALGDSYSSAPLVPTTDVANGCFRSDHNYATLVAAQLDAGLTDVTCAGARTIDLAKPQREGIAPQLAALRRDTRLVTLGIGGNDQQVFAQLTRTCPRLAAKDPQGAPCAAYMRRSGSDVLLAALRRTETGVVRALRAVRAAAPDARVLVVGYPQLVDAQHRCQTLPLAAGDYAYGERVNRALSDALRDAARATGATYVDVWRASQGHDICSADPWVNGSVTDQQRALAYHPFAVEQQEVARLVVAAAER